MLIKHIAVTHFRGIKSLDWHVNGRLICLVGPGDSTKTTILDAIEFALAPRWYVPFPHPDPAVDLCLLPIGPLWNKAQKEDRMFFIRCLKKENIPSASQIADLDALEEILMVGYPIGIWDSTNNMPICRRGITATHPRLDYEGRKEFLIDVACFPGSSGSPVLLYNLGMRRDKRGNRVLGRRMFLLGVLYAGPQYTVEGEIKVVPIPTHTMPTPVSETRIPVNLGMVIKAERILELQTLLPQPSDNGKQ